LFVASIQEAAVFRKRSRIQPHVLPYEFFMNY
jgi:hypothetical protein